MSQMLNVLIVDDELLCIEHLKQLLSHFDYVRVVGGLTDSEGLIELLQTAAVDLLFLDIKIQQESGFSIAEYVHKRFPDKMIVFTTGFEDFALRGYEYEPLDFLTKPVNIIRLERALSHAMLRKTQKLPRPHAKIGIQTTAGLRIIEIDKILYIEKTGRKLQIVYGQVGQPERILVRSSLAEMEKIFEGYNFARIHQSFLVPLHRICGILTTDIRNSYQIELEGVKEKLPLSRHKYAELRNLLEGDHIRFIQ